MGRTFTRSVGTGLARTLSLPDVYTPRAKRGALCFWEHGVMQHRYVQNDATHDHTLSGPHRSPAPYRRVTYLARFEHERRRLRISHPHDHCGETLCVGGPRRRGGAERGGGGRGKCVRVGSERQEHSRRAGCMGLGGTEGVVRGWQQRRRRREWACSCHRGGAQVWARTWLPYCGVVLCVPSADGDFTEVQPGAEIRGCHQVSGRRGGAGGGGYVHVHRTACKCLRDCTG